MYHTPHNNQVYFKVEDTKKSKVICFLSQRITHMCQTLQWLVRLDKCSDRGGYRIRYYRIGGYYPRQRTRIGILSSCSPVRHICKTQCHCNCTRTHIINAVRCPLCVKLASCSSSIIRARQVAFEKQGTSDLLFASYSDILLVARRTRWHVCAWA